MSSANLSSPKSRSVQFLDTPKSSRENRSMMSMKDRNLSSLSRSPLKDVINLERREIDSNVIMTEYQLPDDEKPRFPIRIAIEKMIVKQNYLEPGKHTGSVRKASSNTSALSIQSEKKNKTNKKTEEIKRRASARSEASRASQQKLAAQKSKREMLVEQIQKSSINDIRLSSNEPNLNALEQNISAVIEQIIEKKLKKIGLDKVQFQFMKSNIQKDISNQKRMVSSSSQSRSIVLDKKEPKQARPQSAEKHWSSKSYEYYGLDDLKKEPSVNREDIIKKAKQIIKQNIQKYNQMTKQKEEEEKQEQERKNLRIKELLDRNDKIREENKAKLKFKSQSPYKHKYGWGADQTRLENKVPIWERKISLKDVKQPNHKKEEKKPDPEKRREEIGLSFINKYEDETLKRIKKEYKHALNTKMKELDEKYKEKKQQKSEEEKAKLGSLVEQSKEKWKNEEKKAKEAKCKQKENKKEKLNKFFEGLKDIQKNPPIVDLPKKPKSKKLKRPSILDQDDSSFKFTENSHRDTNQRYLNMAYKFEKFLDIIVRVNNLVGVSKGYQAIKSFYEDVVEKEAKMDRISNASNPNSSHNKRVQKAESHSNPFEAIKPSRKEQIFKIITKQKIQLTQIAPERETISRKSEKNITNGVESGHHHEVQKKAVDKRNIVKEQPKRAQSKDSKLDKRESRELNQERNGDYYEAPKRPVSKDSKLEKREYREASQASQDRNGDFDDIIFTMNSEELIKMQYLPVVK